MKPCADCRKPMIVRRAHSSTRCLGCQILFGNKQYNRRVKYELPTERKAA